MKRIDKTKEKILKCFEECKAIVTAACKKAGVDRVLFYRYYNNDEAFKAKIEEIREAQIDFVESKLMEGIDKLDSSLIRYYLSTKGKKRGYSLEEKLDITTNGNDINMQPIINISVVKSKEDLSDPEEE
jgi:hypothetical protein